MALKLKNLSGRAVRLPIFLVLICELAQIASAQTPNIHVVHPGIDGFAVTQDSTGFMWVVTKEGAVRYDGRRIVRYTNDSEDSTSIALNNLETIIPASNGGVWVGTWGAGVNLFVPESESFERFLPGVFVLELLEDSRGMVWVGTQEGVIQLDPNTGASRNHDMGGAVSVLYEDRQSTVWAGIGEARRAAVGALQRYDPELSEFVPYLIANSEEATRLGVTGPGVWAIHEDRNGTLWVGSAHLFEFDRRQMRLEISNVPDARGMEVQSFLEIPNGVLYIGTIARGMYRYDLTSGVLESAVKGMWLEALIPDSNGMIWAGSYRRTVTRYDPLSKTSVTWKHDPLDPNSLPDRLFVRMFKDRSGMIWTSGIAAFDPIGKGFRFLKAGSEDPSALGDGSIDAIDEGPDGSIWLGSGDSGLYRLDPETGQLDNWRSDPEVPNSLVSDEVWSLLAADDGTIWVGSWNDGISRLDPETGIVRRFKAESSDLLADNIPSILSGPEGTVEVLTVLGHQIYDITSDSWRSVAENEAVNDDAISGYAAISLLIDSQGRRWMATEGSGLFMYPPFSQRPIQFLHEPGMVSGLGTNDISILFEDSRGTIWIGTGDRGLLRVIPSEREDSLEVRAYGSAEGLLDVNVVSVLEDGSGRIWIASGERLAVLDPTTDRFRLYDSHDGLGIGRFGHGAAYYSQRSGLAYWGHSEGLLVFDPEEVIRTAPAPEVVLSGFRRFNSDIEAGTPIDVPGIWRRQNVTLTHKDNIVEIDLATTTYRNADRQQFAYQLVGFSDTWFQLGNNSSITLTNLSPGTYDLNVQASNDDGIWSDGKQVLTINVLPPWWRSKVAYFIYGMLLIGSIVAADRFQRRRLLLRERRQAELREAELKAETAEAQAGEAKALADKAEAQANEAEAARRALQAENERKELELQKAKELEEAFRALEEAHERLKSTQDQLVHSEKMASLGLLTAGIAHEIKNPLNFVNNFAELNAELAEELQETAAGMDVPEEFEDLIADVLMNAQQIAKHGKRADTIVASMMDHAVASSGAREPHDINAQIQEYANLSYHAYQANKGQFECQFEWELDAGVGSVSMVAQEMGRVWLNVFNNAYDAMKERASSADEGSFTPTIRVKTIPSDAGIEVRISDNGIGIDVATRDKIFDPFYTTKPTGFGNTGLGLSLTHDIVSKGHGGSIRVEDTPGGGITFVIVLPPESRE